MRLRIRSNAFTRVNRVNRFAQIGSGFLSREKRFLLATQTWIAYFPVRMINDTSTPSFFLSLLVFARVERIRCLLLPQSVFSLSFQRQIFKCNEGFLSYCVIKFVLFEIILEFWKHLFYSQCFFSLLNIINIACTFLYIIQDDRSGVFKFSSRILILFLMYFFKGIYRGK